MQPYLKETLFRKRPKCYWCDCPVVLTSQESDNQATLDHVYSKWNMLRHSNPESAQQIVLACRRCNQFRAVRDMHDAYALYPQLKELREVDMVTLKAFYSSMLTDSYKSSEGIWVKGHPLFSKQLITLKGKKEAWVGHSYYHALRNSVVLRINNSKEYFLRNNIDEEYFHSVAVTLMKHEPKCFVFMYNDNDIPQDSVVVYIPVGYNKFVMEYYRLTNENTHLVTVSKLSIKLEEDITLTLRPEDVYINLYEQWENFNVYERMKDLFDIDATLLGYFYDNMEMNSITGNTTYSMLYQPRNKKLLIQKL